MSTVVSRQGVEYCNSNVTKLIKAARQGGKRCDM